MKTSIAVSTEGEKGVTPAVTNGLSRRPPRVNKTLLLILQWLSWTSNFGDKTAVVVACW